MLFSPLQSQSSPPWLPSLQITAPTSHSCQKSSPERPFIPGWAPLAHALQNPWYLSILVWYYTMLYIIITEHTLFFPISVFSRRTRTLPIVYTILSEMPIPEPGIWYMLNKYQLNKWVDERVWNKWMAPRLTGRLESQALEKVSRQRGTTPGGLVERESMIPVER